MTENATFTDLLVNLLSPILLFLQAVEQKSEKFELEGILEAPGPTPHLTDKETEARRQAAQHQGQKAGFHQICCSLCLALAFQGPEIALGETLKITSVCSKPCHAVQ